MHEMRITVYGKHDTAICRDVRVPSLLDMLTAISAAVRELCCPAVRRAV